MLSIILSFPSPMSILNQSIVNRNHIENEALVNTVDVYVEPAARVYDLPAWSLICSVYIVLKINRK